jgi:hypothetical protein
VDHWGRKRLFVGVGPEGFWHSLLGAIAKELEVVLNELWRKNSLPFADLCLLRLALGSRLFGRWLFIFSLYCSWCLLWSVRVCRGLLLFRRSSCLPHGQLTEEPFKLFCEDLVLLDLGHCIFLWLLLLSSFLLLPLFVLLFLLFFLCFDLLSRLLLVFFWSSCTLSASFTGFWWCGSFFTLSFRGNCSICFRLLILFAALPLWLLLSACIPVVSADLLRCFFPLGARSFHLESKK